MACEQDAVAGRLFCQQPLGQPAAPAPVEPLLPIQRAIATLRRHVSRLGTAARCNAVLDALEAAVHDGDCGVTRVA